jgi:hypothetical protein
MNSRMLRTIQGLTATAALLAGSLAFAAPAAASFDYSCFGKTGTFKTGTDIQKPDWSGDGKYDECFGIAPDRTIWHVYRSSNGWKQMVGNGRADDTLDTVNSGGGNYYIIVYVANPASHWYNLHSGSDGWGSWYKCLGGEC